MGAADRAGAAAVRRELRDLPRGERPRRRGGRGLRPGRGVGLSVAPSSVVAPNIQAQADGELFHTITNGVRNMPAYAHQVRVQDRWAIVAYLRVLQYAAGK